jgi:hypothetical protein
MIRQREKNFLIESKTVGEKTFINRSDWGNNREFFIPNACKKR